ncbi:MAG TPA: ATP-binding protein, partial [Vicinamibacterales bacterium]|nr:ATP-binding protein [Vicinamibacterales bacterium]
VLPAEITLCLFRVVQEALHNAYKHSAATYVAIQLTSNDPRGLALTIIDDGIGFNVDDAWVCGLGLVSMAERVESVGGRMEIRSGPGSGTRVQVTVPIPPAPLSQNAATLPVH